MKRVVAHSNRRRAVVAVFSAVSMVMVLSFAVLAIDVGHIYATRAELQHAADAAALAAANDLAFSEVSSADAGAMDAASQYAAMNKVVNLAPHLAATDVVLGRAVETNGRFQFSPGGASPDAVRVTVRRTEASENGALPLFFAPILGVKTTDVAASAAATLIPRDIAVVIDLSGSMKHDSYLRFYDQVQINSRDVWAALNGPTPSRPYTPGAEHETEYATDDGPTIGVMDTWGDPINPDDWDPTADPGLWYIPQNAPCTVPAISSSLVERGYSATHIDAVMNRSTSGTDWQNRTAVMIGLANWTPSSGTDTTVGSSELSWIAYPSYRKTWNWTDYLGWAAESNSKLTAVHPEFRFRFGLKTFVDFMLDRVDNHSQTDLTFVPEEPITAVKDAVQTLANTAGVLDQMSLEVFASTGRHEIDLSVDKQRVADRLYAMQANHYDNSTNIGEGLQRAIEELSSSRARDGARKVIVLMSDGMSTMGPDPVQLAQQASDLGITIYSVSVGALADRDTMQAAAEAASGEEFYAIGSPDEYTVQLQDIFKTIGGRRPVVLIE